MKFLAVSLLTLSLVVGGCTRQPVVKQDVYPGAKHLKEWPFTSTSPAGFPLVEFFGTQEIHPVKMSQYLYDVIHDGTQLSPENYEHLKALVPVLLSEKDYIDKEGRLLYSKEFRAGLYRHDFQKNWSSAMAQGQFLSVLVRLAKLFPDHRQGLEKLGHKILQPLAKEVSEGGLSYKVKVGKEEVLFFAEYPVPHAPPITLNGNIFCLLGVLEFSEEFGSDFARDLGAKGLKALAEVLPFYDTFPMSSYDLAHLSFPDTPPLVKESYHHVHINLLNHLNKMSGGKYRSELFKCVGASMARKVSTDKIKKAAGGKINSIKKGKTIYHKLDRSCEPHWLQTAEVYINKQICRINSVDCKSPDSRWKMNDLEKDGWFAVGDAELISGKQSHIQFGDANSGTIRKLLELKENRKYRIKVSLPDELIGKVQVTLWNDTLWTEKKVPNKKCSWRNYKKKKCKRHKIRKKSWWHGNFVAKVELQDWYRDFFAPPWDSHQVSLRLSSLEKGLEVKNIGIELQEFPAKL